MFGARSEFGGEGDESRIVEDVDEFEARSEFIRKGGGIIDRVRW